MNFNLLKTKETIYQVGNFILELEEMYGYFCPPQTKFG